VSPSLTWQGLIASRCSPLQQHDALCLQSASLPLAILRRAPVANNCPLFTDALRSRSSTRHTAAFHAHWSTTPSCFPAYFWTSVFNIFFFALGGGYNYDSTAIRPRYERPFDDPRFDRRPTCVWAAALKHKINKQTGRRECGYITMTLMTFDKQSNGRRIEIKSNSNRSCNHGIKQGYVSSLRVYVTAKYDIHSLPLSQYLLRMKPRVWSTFVAM